MTDRILVTVELSAHDAAIAGAHGAARWLTPTACEITTNTAQFDALMARLGSSENVVDVMEDWE